MKKFLIRFVLFIFFASVTYGVGVFIWKEIGYSRFKGNINYRIGAYGNMYTRVREIPSFQNVDVLFLGSSHAYRGFDVRIFESAGLTCFNLGSSAQTPIQTHVLLSRYLDLLNPKIVVYEVYPKTFCLDGVESSADIIANDVNDWNSLSMLWETKNVKVLNTLVYAFTCDLMGLNKDFKEPWIKEGNEDMYVSGGYVEKKVLFNNPTEYSDNHWTFNPSQIAKFELILEVLKSKSIQTYLVFNPITTPYYASFDNKNEFDSLMSGYGDYYNFNGVIDLDDSLHFYDNNHMNQYGVHIFNKELIKLIEKK